MPDICNAEKATTFLFFLTLWLARIILTNYFAPPLIPHWAQNILPRNSFTSFRTGMRLNFWHFYLKRDKKMEEKYLLARQKMCATINTEFLPLVLYSSTSPFFSSSFFFDDWNVNAFKIVIHEISKWSIGSVRSAWKWKLPWNNKPWAALQTWQDIIAKDTRRATPDISNLQLIDKPIGSCASRLSWSGCDFCNSMNWKCCVCGRVVIHEILHSQCLAGVFAGKDDARDFTCR